MTAGTKDDENIVEMDVVDTLAAAAAMDDDILDTPDIHTHQRHQLHYHLQILVDTLDTALMNCAVEALDDPLLEGYPAGGEYPLGGYGAAAAALLLRPLWLLWDELEC